MAAVRKFSAILAHLLTALKRAMFLRSAIGTWSPSGPEFRQGGPMGDLSVVKRVLNLKSNEIQFLRSGIH
jgi:hypothetical protein